jgi:hypothetical protein
MIYAVRIRRPAIDLFARERPGPLPPDYRVVTRSSFRRCWRLRDGVHAFGPWPTNPYEASAHGPA